MKTISMWPSSLSQKILVLYLIISLSGLLSLEWKHNFVFAQNNEISNGIDPEIGEETPWETTPDEGDFEEPPNPEEQKKLDFITSLADFEQTNLSSLSSEIASLDKQKIALSSYDEYELYKYLQVWKVLQTDQAALDYYKKNKQPPQYVLDNLKIDKLQPYDIRIIELLNYLVRPQDQGGGGHEFIRAKRIRSGYKTEKKQLSRESEFKEEDSPNISAHFDGQAVDISEVDYLKCTLLKRRRALSTKRRKQPGKPIKVAWQSDKGVAGELPFGNNFDEIAKNLILSELGQNFSPQGILEGDALSEIISSVAKRRLEEELELPEGSLENSTQDSLYYDLAYALLAHDMEANFSRVLNSGAYSQFVETASISDLYIRLVLNAIEDDLGLPRGSIDVNSVKSADDVNDFYQILKNIGKRKVENDFGLPAGELSSGDIDWGKVAEKVNQKKQVYAQTDQALGLPTTSDGASGSSTTRLLNRDEGVFYVIGAAGLAQALNYDGSEKTDLIRAVEQRQTDVKVHFRNREFSFVITAEDLEKIFGKTTDIDSAAEDDYVSENLPKRIETYKKEFGQDAPVNIRITGPMEQYLREEYRAKIKKENSRKATLERVGEQLFNQAVDKNIKLVRPEIRESILEIQNRSLSSSVSASDFKNIIEQKKIDEVLKFSAYKIMENTLNLPEGSLKNTFFRDKDPGKLLQNIGQARIAEVLSQYNVSNIEQLVANFKNSDLAVDRIFFLQNNETFKLLKKEVSQADYEKKVGETHLKRQTASEIALLFDFDIRLGNYQLTDQDIQDLAIGNWAGVLLKIGSRFAEEELEFPVGVIYNVVASNDPLQAIWEQGGQRIGRVFGLARLDIQGITNIDQFRERLGKEKVEQTLVLNRGSFDLSKDINFVKQQNGQERFSKIFQDPAKIDRLFSISSDTTKQLLEGKISLRDYALKVSDQMVTESVLKDLDIDQILGLDEQYEISGKDLYEAIRDNDFDKLKDQLVKGFGYSIDNILRVDPGTTDALVSAQSSAEREIILVEQGAKMLGRMLGFPIEAGSFPFNVTIDEKVLIRTYREGRVPSDTVIEATSSLTKIPSPQDARAFYDGRVRDGLTYWGMAYFADQNRGAWGDDLTAAYDEVRMAFWGDPNFDNSNISSPERDFVNQQLQNIPETERAGVVETARREFRAQQMRNISYKIITHRLQQIDSHIPDNFAQVMLRGTDSQRAEMLINYLGRYALEELVGLGLSQADAQIIVNVVSDGNVDSGKLSQIKDSLLNWLDSQAAEKWFGASLPSGTFKAIFYFVARRGDVPSDLKNAYQNWAQNLVFNWVDNKWFGGNLGTAKQVYDAYRNYKTAYDAYQAAKAAGDAAQIAQTSRSLSQIKANALIYAVNLVFGKQLAKLDQALGLVPGSMSLLVSFLIAPSPITLVLLVGLNLFGVYKVEMYCATADYPKYGGRYWGGRYPSEVEQQGEPGIFNALNTEEYRAGLMAAAQWKVKKLVDSLLSAKRADKNIRPTQIMLLRQEDVDRVSDQLNKLYGLAATRLRSGMWANPLIWEYVHVGY